MDNSIILLLSNFQRIDKERNIGLGRWLISVVPASWEQRSGGITV
jgi:hypothetical protein